MLKYAIVKDNVVVNFIEYEEQPTTPPAGFEDGHTAIQVDSVNIGWVYKDGKFTNPNPPKIIDELPSKTLTDMILANPTELAKLKQALGV